MRSGGSRNGAAPASPRTSTDQNPPPRGKSQTQSGEVTRAVPLDRVAHATALHLLGLDHKKLSFYHNGINRRLTDVHGHVFKPLLA